MLFILQRQRQDKCKVQKQKSTLSKRIENIKELDITCLLGSNRIVNVCTRKGSKTGSSGCTGRNDENGTLTCHSNTDKSVIRSNKIINFKSVLVGMVKL